jgi:general secretion pathway protein N
MSRLLALVALLALTPPALAATSAVEPPRLAQPPGTISTDKPPAAPQVRTTRANPLWAIPLSTLTITRARPIFAPSRRPPAPPVAAAPPPPPPAAPKQPPKPPEPERLTLALIGTVVSSTEGIGIFLDQPTRRMIRLKTGEEHGGWVLRSVRAREVTLEKGERVEILSLPQPGVRPQQQL